MPIVTAINGIAAGAGMSLALMGDTGSRRTRRRSASLRADRSGAGLRLVVLLPRMIGMARAMELSLLAERLPAETALAWGMIIAS